MLTPEKRLELIPIKGHPANVIVTNLDSGQRCASTPISVSHFRLTPKKSQHQSWKIEVVRYTQTDSISPDTQQFDEVFAFNVLFEFSETQPQKSHPLQAAILEVKIDNSQDPNMFWQFYRDGVIYTGDSSDLNCRIRPQITDSGTTLTLTIDQVQPFSNENGNNAYCIIPFRYAASCVDLSNPLQPGQMEVWYSQDPSVGVGGAIPP